MDRARHLISQTVRVTALIALAIGVSIGFEVLLVGLAGAVR